MAKFCTNCGATLEDDKKFCTECGATVNEAPPGEGAPGAAAPQPAPAPAPQAAPQPASAPAPQAVPVYVQAPAAVMPAPAAQPAGAGGDVPPPKGSKYEPISTGGFIGIMLLMCIPIVGQILMIVWACGGCRKVNKRSLARASLIMMVVMLIIGFLISLAVKTLWGKAMNMVEQETGINISALTGGAAGQSGESGGLSGLLGIASGQSSGTTGSNDLSGILGLVGGLTGSTGGVTNGDIGELEDLSKLLEGLGGITGEASGLEGLLSGTIEANQDAEAANDGWPKTLRKYPGGKSTATASYRTEITGTTLDEMKDWIADLKSDGFQYQDFYGFGMSEQDMLNMNGWWAYDGKTYLSVSYSDGTVIVDHTKELPDLGSYFK